MASQWSHPNHQQAIQELGSFLAHFHSPCCFNWAHFLPCHYVPHCTQFTQRGSLALPVIRLTCEVLTIYKTVSLTVACAVGVEPNLIAISCHTVLSHPAGLPCIASSGGWGELTLEGTMGMCCPQDPPFSSHLSLEIHHFKPFSSSRDPTSIFQEILLTFSSPIFADLAKFQLLGLKFLQKFTPEMPVSSQNISSGDPTFENLGGTYLSKNFMSTPSQLY